MADGRWAKAALGLQWRVLRPAGQPSSFAPRPLPGNRWRHWLATGACGKRRVGLGAKRLCLCRRTRRTSCLPGGGRREARWIPRDVEAPECLDCQCGRGAAGQGRRPQRSRGGGAGERPGQQRGGGVRTPRGKAEKGCEEVEAPGGGEGRSHRQLLGWISREGAERLGG